jgi:hypothetical protein
MVLEQLLLTGCATQTTGVLIGCETTIEMLIMGGIIGSSATALLAVVLLRRMKRQKIQH